MTPSDPELLAAITAFAERARRETRACSVTVDAWMRTDNPAKELVELLEQEPAVASASGTGVMMRLAPYLGFAAGTWQWVLGYVHETVERGTEPLREAERLLRFLRMEGGTVPARIRTTLFGFAVEGPIELPFGRLEPATAQDLAIVESPDLPPATVFECVADVAAKMTSTTNDLGWSIEEGERLEAEMYARVDQAALGRLLVTMVFCHPDGLVQEHVVAVQPFYGDRRVGRNRVPLGPALATWTAGHRTLTIDTHEIQEAAAVVARVDDVRRTVVAARRYFQAGAERARPADAIVDFATAIEALAGTSNGEAQNRWITAALASDPLWNYRVADEFEVLKDARNSILHRGMTPPGASALVLWTRSMVSHAIMASVLRDTGAKPEGILDPNRPQWPPRSIGKS